MVSHAESRLISCIGFSVRQARTLQKVDVMYHLKCALGLLCSEQGRFAGVRSINEDRYRRTICLDDSLFPRQVLPGNGTSLSTDADERSLNTQVSDHGTSVVEEESLHVLPCSSETSTIVLVSTVAEGDGVRDRQAGCGDADVDLQTARGTDDDHDELTAQPATPEAQLPRPAHGSCAPDESSAEVPESPRGFVRRHVLQAANVAEAIDGLSYLRSTFRTALKSHPSSSPERTRLMQIYLEVCEELRTCQGVT